MSLVQGRFKVLPLADAMGVKQRCRREVICPYVMSCPEPASHALIERQWSVSLQEVATRNKPQFCKRRPSFQAIPLEARFRQLDEARGRNLLAAQRFDLTLAQLPQRQRHSATFIHEVP